MSRVYTYLRGGHIRPPYTGIFLHITVFGYLFLAQMDTSWQTENLGFSNLFHLYIHDHEQEHVSGTLTCGMFMYVPPKCQSVYVLCYSVTFIRLKQMAIHQITSNLGFSIPFHLYIHDHDLEQASVTLTCGVLMYVPPISQNAQVRFLVCSYLYLGEMDTDPSITSNLGFSISFHLYIHDHDLEWASDILN